MAKSSDAQAASDAGGNTVPAKVKAFFHAVYKAVSSSLGLLIILTAYSFIGAAIFHAIEGGHEKTEKQEVQQALDQVLRAAWNASLTNLNESEFQSVMRSELRGYEMALKDAFLHGVTSDSDLEIWDFWGAFLFCATIYTTIGYGHIAPATQPGRVVTMVYALIGIPLCLVVMASVGKLFTRAIKFLWAFVRRFYYTGNCKKVPKSQIQQGAARNRDVTADESEAETTDSYPIDDDFNLPPIIAIAITVVYILVGAFMYTQWEDWTYLEAFYFVFVSISTIGFGDVIPEHPRYFLASSIYILIGLSLVAMVINVIMEVVHSTIHKAKDRVMHVGQKMRVNLPMGSIDSESKENKAK